MYTVSKFRINSAEYHFWFSVVNSCSRCHIKYTYRKNGWQLAYFRLKLTFLLEKPFFSENSVTGRHYSNWYDNVTFSILLSFVGGVLYISGIISPLNTIHLARYTLSIQLG
jgi:hypothetical protein